MNILTERQIKSLEESEQYFNIAKLFSITEESMPQPEQQEQVPEMTEQEKLDQYGNPLVQPNVIKDSIDQFAQDKSLIYDKINDLLKNQIKLKK